MRISSRFISSISPSSTQGDLNNSAMPCIEFKFSNNNNSILTSNLSFGTKYPMNVESEASSALNSLVSTNAPLQTTLVSVKAQKTISVLSFYCPFQLESLFFLSSSFLTRPTQLLQQKNRKQKKEHVGDSIRRKYQDSKFLFDLKTSWCCVNKSETFYLLLLCFRHFTLREICEWCECWFEMDWISFGDWLTRCLKDWRRIWVERFLKAF